MRKHSLYFILIIFTSLNLLAQENKNELGISLFSLETNEPGHFDFGLGGYINPLNSIVYKRKIKEDIKLRGILTAEINASSSPDYRDDCVDCGSFTHTANLIGLSAGIQTGRTFGKFSPYGYLDLFYSYKFETAEYFYPLSSNGGYSREINSIGTRLGFGLEYNFSERLSLALEPSLSIAQQSIHGVGYQVFVLQTWDGTKQFDFKFRGVNMLSLNVKF